MPIDPTRGFKRHVRGDPKSQKDEMSNVYEQKDKHGNTKFYDYIGNRELPPAQNWVRDSRPLTFGVSISICKRCKAIVRGDMHKHVCEVKHGNR